MGTIWVVCADDSTALGDVIACRLAACPLAAIYLHGDCAATAAPLARRLDLSPQPLAACDITGPDWFADLAARHADREIALFASTRVVRHLIGHILALSPEQAARIGQRPGAINRVNREPHRIVVAGLNDCCHLQE